MSRKSINLNIETAKANTKSRLNEMSTVDDISKDKTMEPQMKSANSQSLNKISIKSVSNYNQGLTTTNTRNKGGSMTEWPHINGTKFFMRKLEASK